MTEQILFLNIGWMDFYNGLSNDQLVGGGRHVKEEGWGGEVFNFRRTGTKTYGYVQPKIDRKYNNRSTIKLEKIGGTLTQDKIKNVTVVWTATDPINRGTRIIGWYRKATVYRYMQYSPIILNRKLRNENIGFFVEAKFKDCILLPQDERVVLVRRQEKNWMGQSNVWYAENNRDFKDAVLQYVSNRIIPIPPNPVGTPRQLDVLKRIEVEKKAIKFVVGYYESLSYTIKSVEKDNVGWDLDAKRDRQCLKLEVKGLSGKELVVDLTPNEYKNMLNDLVNYRLCIVTSALVAPKLFIFSYSQETLAWQCSTGEKLAFTEIIAARVSLSHQ